MTTTLDASPATEVLASPREGVARLASLVAHLSRRLGLTPLGPRHPDPAERHDVDLLVPEGVTLLALLDTLPAGVQLVQHIQHESTAHYFVLADRRDTCPDYVALDLSSDVRRGGRVYFEARELLDARRRGPNGWRLASHIEFASYLIKKVDKLDLPPEAAQVLSELYTLNCEECDALLAHFWRAASARMLAHAASTSAWNEVRRDLPALRRELRRREALRHPLRTLAYRLAEVPRVAHRLLHPTGLHIVLLGPDGSGKSSLARTLEAALAPAFRRTTVRHLQPGLARRRPSAPTTKPHALPPRSRAVSVLKALYWLFDFTAGYALLVRPLLTRSTLVIFDRYLVDATVDPQRYRYAGPPWLLALAWRVAPKPDVMLFLDAPLEVLRSRKEEVAFEETARQRAAYLELAARLEGARTIDATQPLEDVTRDAVAAILDALAARISRRLARGRRR